jgi:hypothetical protein
MSGRKIIVITAILIKFGLCVVVGVSTGGVFQPELKYAELSGTLPERKERLTNSSGQVTLYREVECD